MALTYDELKTATSGISSNPWDRVPPQMKDAISTNEKLLFDVHTHVFNYKDIPDMFLGMRFDINKPMVQILSLLVGVADFLPFIKLADLGRLLKKLRSSEDALFKDALADYQTLGYEPIFNVLMMDMRAIENKKKKDLRTFEEQCESLVELRNNNLAHILPFIALDPEHNINHEQNFIDAFKTEQNFFGVKIYPSLGYLPSHPSLMNIFKICEEKNIPVTTHCSSGKTRASCKKIRIKGLKMLDGQPVIIDEFVEFENHKAETYRKYFNGPERWLPVLHECPNLKLNLAHFGGEHEWKCFLKEGSEWINTIEEMLLNPLYPNVYTDFSFTFSFKKYNQVLKGWLESKPHIKDYVLNGSDYFLTATERPLKRILRKYFRQLGTAHIHQLGHTNAQKFLFSQHNANAQPQPLIS